MSTSVGSLPPETIKGRKIRTYRYVIYYTILKQFRMSLFTAVLFVAVYAQFGSSQQSDDLNIQTVSCEEQQETCICSKDYDGCDFKLEIEELQTFTSYSTTSDNNEIITRGTPGATYFFGPSGYEASLDDSACSQLRSNQQPPECNSSCRSPSPIDDERGFRDLSCSIPMTVDGRTYRLFIAVNGRIPGPTLIVSENQIVRVTVTNRLTSEGVTIHWHGMHQRGTPWMDGVASLSQIPIVPGATFQYIFRAYPAGTHWYHSHLGAQRTDGLFGGLIVRERLSEDEKETVSRVLGDYEDIPEEHTLTLLDWQRESSLNLFVRIHSTLGFYPTKNLGVVPNTRPMSDPRIPGGHKLYSPRTTSADNIEVGPVPYWSGLINGRGRYDVNTSSTLSSFNVSEGKRYRFRLIGAQSLYAYRFEIVEHKLTVIATDGHFVTPVEVDYIIIHSGERYDFILNASQSGNYLIRASTLEVSTSESARSEHTAEAILHYVQAEYPLDPEDLYTSSNLNTIRRSCSDSECVTLNCPFKAYLSSENTRCIIINELTSLFDSKVSDLPRLQPIMDNTNDRIKFFNFGFEGQSTTSAINGRNFLPPPTPYQLYCGQYGEDDRGTDVNTCGQCDSKVTEDSQAELCTCVRVVKIVTDEDPKSTSDKSVMMVFSAVGSGTLRDFAHPVHLHGHSFYVVDVGHGTYNPSSNALLENARDVVCDSELCMEPDFTKVNAERIPNSVSSKFSDNGMLPKNTIRKDTVIVPAGGYVVVAFQADNPGYWFMHCHIEVHQLEGMAVIIQEYDDTKHNYALPENITKVGNFKWTHEDFVRLESSAMVPGLSFKYMIMSSVIAITLILALQ